MSQTYSSRHERVTQQFKVPVSPSPSDQAPSEVQPSTKDAICSTTVLSTDRTRGEQLAAGVAPLPHKYLVAQTTPPLLPMRSCNKNTNMNNCMLGKRLHKEMMCSEEGFFFLQEATAESTFSIGEHSQRQAGEAKLAANIAASASPKASKDDKFSASDFSLKLNAPETKENAANYSTVQVQEIESSMFDYTSLKRQHVDEPSQECIKVANSNYTMDF